MTFTLAVDLDGVVGNYTDYFRQHVSTIKGIPTQELPDPHTWDFFDSGWDIRDRAEFLDLHDAAVSGGMFSDMNCYEGASETLWRLNNRGIHISIVTARLSTHGNHKRAISDTVSFLDKHDIPYRDILFLSDKTRYSFDLLIDDSPHNINNAIKNKSNYLIFTQGYNLGLPGPRADNWSEVLSYVSSMHDDMINA